MLQSLTKAAMAGLLLLSLPACGGGDRIQADALFMLAEDELEQGNFLLAFKYIDSLDATYPRETDTRRKALELRRKVIRMEAERNIVANDSLQAALASQGDSIQQYIRKVDNPIEPYFVSVSRHNKPVVGTTGLEARMAPDGTFYMISSLKGGGVRHTSVSVYAPGDKGATTAAVPRDGERNDGSMGGCEVVHYMMNECDSLGAYILHHRHQSLTLRFNGDDPSKSKSVELSADDADALATMYLAADNVRRRRRAVNEGERLRKVISAAGSQSSSSADSIH